MTGAGANEARSQSIRVLDENALMRLSAESNSSKFVIDAHHREVEEIADLSHLPKLCALDVSFNRLKGLKNLETAKDLRELKAYNNHLTSSAGFKGNPGLESIFLNENQIAAISDEFIALVKLKTLWLCGNRIQRIQNLSSCRLLVYLDLSRNRLAGCAATGLENLCSLEYLNLSDNQLSSMGNISHMTKLEELDLSGNQLCGFDGLAPAKLTMWRLNRNQLTSLKGFPSHLEMLNELYLQDNAISDSIDVLATRCPQLESLDLCNNRIANIAQLQALGTCATLQDLWIRGNPCCLSDRYIVDVMATLPMLKTLDSLADTKLQASVESLKSGGLTQDALLLATTKPATPSQRPASASLIRPGSASQSLNRPITPGSRPHTPDRPPVFYQPSNRMGTLVKLASTAEIESTRAEVTERLQKMKTMLSRMCPDDPQKPAPSSIRSAARANEPAAKHVPALQFGTASLTAAMERKPSSTSVAVPLKEVPSAAAIPHNRQATSTVKKSRGVDAGTDPLDSYTQSICELSARSPPRVATSEIEIQTAALIPPAPISTIRGSDAQADQNALPTDSANSTIEHDMKQVLLQYANTSLLRADDNQHDHEQPEDLAMESPRFISVKTAERQRLPYRGAGDSYRAFRVPSRFKAAANASQA